MARLKDTVKIKPNMKILIDKNVESDENGSFLVNVGYVRVSTDRQAEKGYGLDVQERDLLNYAKLKGFTNFLLIIDDGYTGTSFDRPGLNQIKEMIEDFNLGKTNVKINSLVIPKIDRLGRSLLGILQFINDYIFAKKDSKSSEINKNKEDINFISVGESYFSIEKSNPFSKLVLMLFASLAEFDRDTIVQKLKAGKTQRVASGKWMGGAAKPFGYRYDEKSGVLEVVPEEAQAVKEVFRLYLEEKLSPQAIALKVGLKNDKNVYDILRRKTYTGTITFNGTEYKGLHQPIISIETFNEAQGELESRSVPWARAEYLLAGLIFCGECGSRMRYQRWGKGNECKILCYSTQKNKEYLVKNKDCPSQRYWQSEIEDAVIKKLFSLKYLGDEDNKKTPRAFNPAQSIQDKIKRLEKQLYRLYDFEDDDDTVLKNKILSVKGEIKQLKAQLADEQEQERIHKKIERTKARLKSIESAWQYMTNKEKQTVCRELIEKVVIFNGGRIDLHLKLESFLVKNENE